MAAPRHLIRRSSMVLADRISDEKREELNELEQKCEDLIDKAIEKGAEVQFVLVRRVMSRGREFGICAFYRFAQSYLEQQIAKAERERMRRESRRQFIIKIKNLFSFRLS